MIFEGSRYEFGDVLRVPDHKGVVRPTLFPRRHTTRRVFDYIRYVTALGDRLDLLAHAFYGDAEQWWRIADTNPEVFYPGDLPEGTLLRIPRGSSLL